MCDAAPCVSQARKHPWVNQLTSLTSPLIQQTEVSPEGILYMFHSLVITRQDGPKSFESCLRKTLPQMFSRKMLFSPVERSKKQECSQKCFRAAILSPSLLSPLSLFLAFALSRSFSTHPMTAKTQSQLVKTRQRLRE